MDENEKNRLSRTSMFFITGFSSLFFSLVIKMLDGSHSRILLLIGAISFFSGLLNGAMEIVICRNERKKKNNRLVS
ncbi:MAG: hypothetical protein WAT34_01695 [Chitinophagaceae bacterium]